MRNQGYCADAVERARTQSFDANDKLVQTRSHVRDTTASKKRQAIMRKGKSTIVCRILLCGCVQGVKSEISHDTIAGVKNLRKTGVTFQF